MTLNRIYSRSRWLFLAAALLGAVPSQASIILNVQSVTVAAGTSGASIDINVQNTGPTQNIAAFSLALSVAGSGVIFTGGNTSTTLTYLFNGDSFDVINSLPYTTVPPPNGQSVQASDLSNSGAGTDMGAVTLGLGHLFFDVAANVTPGVYGVTIVPDCSNPNACTSFSDSAFNNVPFSLGSNGTITVTGTSGVPEPATLLLALFAVPAIALHRRLRR
jgi:hypothetical protein